MKQTISVKYRATLAKASAFFNEARRAAHEAELRSNSMKQGFAS